MSTTRNHTIRRLVMLSVSLMLLSIFALPGGVAAASAPSADVSTFAARVVELTNAQRAKYNLAALGTNASLTSAAQAYAGVLSQDVCFAHTCPPEPNLARRLNNAGYSFSGYSSWSWGENIAAGYSTPESVVAAWMASPGHRANILSTRYHDLGVGLVYKAGSHYGYYWVEDFGARNP